MTASFWNRVLAALAWENICAAEPMSAEQLTQMTQELNL